MRLAAVLPVCLAILLLAAPAATETATATAAAAPAAVAAPVAAMPEPTDWSLLLCGLMAAAFIARRKSSWPEG